MRPRVAAVILTAGVVISACGSGGDHSASLVRQAASTTSSTSSPTSTTTATATATVSTVATTTTVPPRPRAAAPRTTVSTTPATGLQAVVNTAVARRQVPVSVVALDLRTGEVAQNLGTRVVL